MQQWGQTIARRAICARAGPWKRQLPEPPNLELSFTAEIPSRGFLALCHLTTENFLSEGNVNVNTLLNNDVLTAGGRQTHRSSGTTEVSIETKTL